MKLVRKCDQYLFTKVRAEPFIESMNVALLTFHANAKTFRTAFFSYKANLLSSLGTMIKPLNYTKKFPQKRYRRSSLKTHKRRIKIDPCHPTSQHTVLLRDPAFRRSRFLRSRVNPQCYDTLGVGCNSLPSLQGKAYFYAKKRRRNECPPTQN